MQNKAKQIVKLRASDKDVFIPKSRLSRKQRAKRQEVRGS